jgi:hypothetical protein
MIWTEEADSLLIKLFDEGGSYGYVAEGMKARGYNVSRNAIAGRKFRIAPKQVFRRQSPLPLKTIPPKAIHPVRPSNQPRSTQMSDKAATAPQQITEKDIEAIRTWEGVDYLALPNNGCKAILDRPRGGQWLLQKVCGKPRATDANGNRSSYCKVHMSLYSNLGNIRRLG